MFLRRKNVHCNILEIIAFVTVIFPWADSFCLTSDGNIRLISLLIVFSTYTVMYLQNLTTVTTTEILGKDNSCFVFRWMCGRLV